MGLDPRAGERPGVGQDQLALAAVGATGEEDDLRLALAQALQRGAAEVAGEHRPDPGAGVQRGLVGGRRGEVGDEADRRDPQAAAGAGGGDLALRARPAPELRLAASSAAA